MSSLHRYRRGTTLSLIGLTQTNKINHLSHASPLQVSKMGKTFEWAAFDVLMGPLHSSSDGAPAYPPLTMFKIVLVQQWYGLSDPGAEEAVRDRLSFRRFCGIPLDQETPDHSSIWRFRQSIDKLGLSGRLLAEVNRQLDALGLIVKRGTLVDATLIAAAVKRPPYGSGGSIRAIRTRG